MCFSFDKPYLYLKDITNGLSKCNSIRYAAYRTAAKLRIIQKASLMDKVQLRVISCVFERHQLMQTENSVQLDQKEVESVLSDIYFGVKKEKDIPLDIEFVCRLMFNFLKNVFDKCNSNTVEVFSFKVGLVLLCAAKPREKYHYFFEQLADHNNCISRKKLEIMLKKMTMLIDYLGEELVFGSELILGTVESCFHFIPGGLGLSEEVFMHWLMQDPQLLVWLSTFYRMQISESVSHSTRCDICKMYPLVGFRYRCLRCLSYDMCQSCFFTGKLNKKHKLKHPVQEFCYPMTSQQSTKAFLLTLKNRLFKKEYKVQYLPALKGESYGVEHLNQSTKLLDEMEISSRAVVNGSRVSLRCFPFKELQNIIVQLERNSEKLIPQIILLCSAAEDSELNEWQTELRNCLTKHRAQVESQVQRLKLLKNYLASKNEKDFHASTPVVDEMKPEFRKRDLIEDLNNFSPIPVQNFRKRGEHSFEKMIWDNYDLGLKPFWENVFSRKLDSRESVEVCEKGPDVENELEPSVWLGGKILRKLQSSSKEGISWLYENSNETYEEEKVRKKNQETLEELKSDFKNIVGKLQELSNITLKVEGGEADTTSDVEREEIDVVGQVDSLFLDFINGAEKLIGNKSLSEMNLN